MNIREEFLQNYLVHLKGAIPRELCDEWVGDYFEHTGIDESAPQSWPDDLNGFSKTTRTVPMAEASPQAWEAICELLGGEELLEHAETSLGVRAGGTSEDGLFTLEDVECVAACTEAPCFTVNYRYFHRATTGSFDEVVADIRAGRSPMQRGGAGDDGDLPEHGTLGRVRQHISDDRRAGVEAPENVTGAPPWLAADRNGED